MNNTMKHTLFYLVLLALLGSCASSNHISFYALQSIDSNKINASIDASQSIGVSRVIVPDYLKNQGVTSLADNTGQLNISLTHAWAGELDTQLTQVAAQNISHHLNHARVWHSPWPHGIRPDVRVQIIIEQLAGNLNQQVELRAKWIINNVAAKSELASGYFSTTVAVEPVEKNKIYGAYTYSMSVAIAELTQVIAEHIARL